MPWTTAPHQHVPRFKLQFNNTFSEAGSRDLKPNPISTALPMQTQHRGLSTLFVCPGNEARFSLKSAPFVAILFFAPRGKHSLQRQPTDLP